MAQELGLAFFVQVLGGAVGEGKENFPAPQGASWDGEGAGDRCSQEAESLHFRPELLSAPKRMRRAASKLAAKSRHTLGPTEWPSDLLLCRDWINNRLLEIQRCRDPAADGDYKAVISLVSVRCLNFPQGPHFGGNLIQWVRIRETDKGGYWSSCRGI